MAEITGQYPEAGRVTGNCFENMVSQGFSAATSIVLPNSGHDETIYYDNFIRSDQANTMLLLGSLPLIRLPFILRSTTTRSASLDSAADIQSVCARMHHHLHGSTVGSGCLSLIVLMCVYRMLFYVFLNAPDEVQDQVTSGPLLSRYCNVINQTHERAVAVVCNQIGAAGEPFIVPDGSAPDWEQKAPPHPSHAVDCGCQNCTY